MSEVRIDVSELEPCEPLERTLEAVAALAEGQWLRIQHRREPHPLYPLLQRLDCLWHCQRDRYGDYEILIWRKQDSAASAAVAELIVDRTD